SKRREVGAKSLHSYNSMILDGQPF
ncbi:MAG: hypothetical protein RL417_1872, partial [Pseudomonadota bacterium]